MLKAFREVLPISSHLKLKDLLRMTAPYAAKQHDHAVIEGARLSENGWFQDI